MCLQSITRYFLVILFLSLEVSTSKCPLNCDCSIVSESQLKNYAKCENLKGFENSAELQSIEFLNLSNANLTKINNNLGKFNFIGIDLSYNRLSAIGELGRQIKFLNLSHNFLTSDALWNIPQHVENLDLSYNKITLLSFELTKLRHLQFFELVGNEINCTCETLEVRNWLVQNHVKTENPIKCNFPPKFGGQSWLHAQQSHVCNIDDDGLNEKNILDEENDLMLNDDENVFNEVSKENEQPEEIGKDFLLAIREKNLKEDSLKIPEGSGYTTLAYSNYSMSENEGSGFIVDGMNSSNELDSEYSGSGAGILRTDVNENYSRKYNAPIESGIFTTENTWTTTEIDEYFTIKTEETTHQPIDSRLEAITELSDNLFVDKLGIMESITDNLEEHTTEISPVQIDTDVTFKTLKPLENGEIYEIQRAGIQVSKETEQNGKSEASSVGANNADNTNTYILLSVILVLLVALILFVAIKQRRARRKNREIKDIENFRDKELCYNEGMKSEKPHTIDRTCENTPLINEIEQMKRNNESKNIFADPKKDDDKIALQPLLQEREPKNDIRESNNNVAVPSKSKDPVSPTEKEASDEKPFQSTQNYPLSKAKGPEEGGSESILSSPKLSRYSPVYSPETGRVKIKLTETAELKTPQLITKSGVATSASNDNKNIVP